MNPEFESTRQALESRLTALILGELDPEQSRALSEALQRDPELAQIHQRLKQTIEFVRATAAAEHAHPQSTDPLRLSDDRRQQLLQRFKTVTPAEFAEAPSRPWIVRLMPLAVAAAVMLLLASLLLPALSKAKSKSSSVAVMNNLRQLDGAKQQWALEYRKADTDIPSEKDLAPYLAKQKIEPVLGEKYRLGAVNEPVIAEVDSDKLGKSLARYRLPSGSPDGRVQLSLEGPVTPPAAASSVAAAVPPPVTTPALATPAEPQVAATESSERRGRIVLPTTDAEPLGLTPPAVSVNEAPPLVPPADAGVAMAVPARPAPPGSTPTAYPLVVGGGAGGGGGGGAPAISGRESELALGNVPPTSPPVASAESELFRRRYGLAPGVASASAPTPGKPELAGRGDQPSASSHVTEDFFGAAATTDPAWIGGLETKAEPRGFFEDTPPSGGPGSHPLRLITGSDDGAVDPATGLPVPQRELRRVENGTLNYAWHFGDTADAKSAANVGVLDLNRNAAGAEKTPVPNESRVGGRLVEPAKESKPTVADEIRAYTGLPAAQGAPQEPPVIAGAPVQTYGRGKFDENGRTQAGQDSPIIPPAAIAGKPTVLAGSLMPEQAAVSEGKTLQNETLRQRLDSPKQAGNIFLPAQSELALRGTFKKDGAEAEVLRRSATRSKSEQHLALRNPEYKAGETARTEELAKKQAELADSRRPLSTKFAAEGIDSSLPKTSQPTVIDRAVAPQKEPSLWNKLTGGAKASPARVKIDRDQSDVALLGDKNAAVYDPYFVQTESETLESEAVLGRVVDTLKLTETWGKNGKALSKQEAINQLRNKLEVKPEKGTTVVEIRANLETPAESAKVANAVADSYGQYRVEQRQKVAQQTKQLREQLAEQEKQQVQTELAAAAKLNERGAPPKQEIDQPAPKPAVPPPVPQPEVATSENAFSTFSLNVSDVSFKLAGASLEKGQLPDPASIRSEEFINAFDYRDPEPPAGVPVAFAFERAHYPFAQNRDLLRFSIKTGAQGRQAGRPLNVVLLLDNSGSMERADRVQIIREALKVLAAQLQPQDKLSVVTFSRTPRLVVDGVPGNQAGPVADEIAGLTPQGGTNLEEAMNLAYQTATRHYQANGINRVVLLTDGAANLGDVEPESLKHKVEAQRKQGIALDCFGIGWEGYNDDLLEVMSRNGDGRYGFINTPGEAATEFAGQLAGALQVAASDVKVQVEFNPARVTAYRQIGYAKHQLTKEQFRDNTVDAAEIGAAEAGNALYAIEVNPAGDGPLAIVRVRYKVPGTADYREQEWAVPYTGAAPGLESSAPAMRLAAAASAFSEWLAKSPYATDVSPDRLLEYLRGVPEVYGADARPRKLEWMIRQANSLGGK